MGEFVQLSVEQRAMGSVARVTLNRPDLHNAFNEVMIQELQSTFAGFTRQSDVRAVVLQAESKSFCAGADLNWMKKMVDYSFGENVADAHTLAFMLRTIQDCPKPVIARIHGAAFGGGVGLVAACDMAVATENATFCLSEVKLGLLPAVISPFVLKKIGPSAARRYFLTAERFSAAEALRIGLINETVPDVDTLDARVDAILDSLLANGPEAMALCKVLIGQVCHTDWDRAVDITTKMIAERRSSKEGQEGMKAFLEKRNPAWTQPEQDVSEASPVGKGQS